MREVFPLVGVDQLRFGMTPLQVRSLYGETQQYEEWMGGNLNDFMFYEGILIGFDGKNGQSPSESSKVVMCEVRNHIGIQMLGIEITHLKKSELLEIFRQRNIPTTQTSDWFLRVPSLGIQLSFNSTHNLENVYLQKDAQAS